MELNKEQTYSTHNALYELKVLGNSKIDSLVREIEKEIGMNYNIQKNFGDMAF